jgi:hypothetical protein
MLDRGTVTRLRVSLLKQDPLTIFDIHQHRRTGRMP